MNDQEYWQGVEQCRERLWRIARMWLSDDSAAMDVVDEAVFRGWRACGRLRHPEYFTTGSPASCSTSAAGRKNGRTGNRRWTSCRSRPGRTRTTCL